MTFCSAEDSVDLFGPDGHFRRELGRQRRTVQQEGDAGRHRQKGLHLVEGVFAAAHYRHVPAAIEKGVTGGTVADAVALKTRQPGMRGTARAAPVARMTASAG